MNKHVLSIKICYENTTLTRVSLVKFEVKFRIYRRFSTNMYKKINKCMNSALHIMVQKTKIVFKYSFT